MALRAFNIMILVLIDIKIPLIGGLNVGREFYFDGEIRDIAPLGMRSRSGGYRTRNFLNFCAGDPPCACQINAIHAEKLSPDQYFINQLNHLVYNFFHFDDAVAAKSLAE